MPQSTAMLVDRGTCWSSLGKLLILIQVPSETLYQLPALYSWSCRALRGRWSTLSGSGDAGGGISFQRVGLTKPLSQAQAECSVLPEGFSTLSWES